MRVSASPLRRLFDSEIEDAGFTLIELLVVIIIIGILAAIAIPVFLNQRKKGYDAQTKSDLREAATAEESYLTDYLVYATTNTQLAIEGWKQSTNDAGLTVITVRNNATNDASGSYCMKATSYSGKTFFYDSSTGLGVTTVVCS